MVREMKVDDGNNRVFCVTIYISLSIYLYQSNHQSTHQGFLTAAWRNADLASMEDEGQALGSSRPV